MIVSISGKKVELREKYPAKEFDGIRALALKLKEDTPFEIRAALFGKCVMEWDFEGDPEDVAAWEQFDLFEMLAIEEGIGRLFDSLYSRVKKQVGESMMPSEEEGDSPKEPSMPSSQSEQDGLLST